MNRAVVEPLVLRFLRGCTHQDISASSGDVDIDQPRNQQEAVPLEHLALHGGEHAD
jgi:hypothetical protein